MGHQPAPFARLTVAAEPQTLALCRHALAGALRDVAIPEDLVDDLKLVLSEVCKNAIEHGYQGRPGTIEIEFRISTAEFEASVRDRGSGAPWSGSAGAGTAVLHSLTSRHEVSHPASGGTLVTFSRAV
jgi:serine/threonine-protein kinase RsbW